MVKKQQSASGSQVEIATSPIHLLHRVGQCATDVFQSEMGEADLTPRQFAVLSSIAQKEGASQTDLVAMTGIDRSTLADIVRRMLKKGLVQRRRTKEDARAYAVKLTEDGRRTLRKAAPLVGRVDQRILDAIPASQRNAFIDMLSTIVETLGEEDEAPEKPVKSTPARKTARKPTTKSIAKTK